MQCFDTLWGGMPCVVLRNEQYEAKILPDLGANCVSLRHRESGTELFRTPASVQDFISSPNVYGIPLLFPPNRIRNGEFSFDGRHYQFPINEPLRHHHIHGFLSRSKFESTGRGMFTFIADVDHPYLDLPHAFSIERIYSLQEDGLHQKLTVTNHSETRMPVGVGFHTALRIADVSTEKANAIRLQIPVIRQWLVNPETIIPTGDTRENTPLLQSLRAGTLCPVGQALSCLLECAKGPIRLYMPNGVLQCDRSDNLRFIVLWNADGNQPFLCPEPQSWLIDAPNIPLDAKKTGFCFLEAGEQTDYLLRYSFEAGGDAECCYLSCTDSKREKEKVIR